MSTNIPTPAAPPKSPLEKLSADEFTLNAQCVLLEMAEKIYQYAVSEAGKEVVILQPDPDPSSTTRTVMKGGVRFPTIYSVEGHDMYGTDVGPAIRRAKPVTSLSDWPSYKVNYDFIKKITLDYVTARFLEITPQQVAQLSPFIMLSVDYYDKKGVRQRRVPLNFPNKTNLETSIFKSTGQRMNGGIREITITHEGIDSATDKIVLINSSFIFQDLRTVTTSNYQELLTLGIAGADSDLRRYINFEFGWDSHARIKGALGLTTMRANVRGELIGYTFDFNEDGSIVLHTQHRGHIHTLFGNVPSANVLSTAKAEEEELKKNKIEVLAAARRQIKSNNLQAKKDAALRNIALSAMSDYLRKIPWQISGYSVYKGERNISLDIPSRHHMRSLIRKHLEANDIDVIADSDAAYHGYDITRSDLKEAATTARLILREAVKNVILDDEMEDLPYRTVEIKMNPQELLSVVEGVQSQTSQAVQNTNVIDTNLQPRKIYQTAKKQYSKQVGLFRFLELFNLISALGKNQKIYYGALSEEQRIDIVAALTHQPTLATAFGTIQAGDFFNQMKQFDSYDPVGATTAVLDQFQTIPFVFLGDFLQTLFEMPASLGGTTTTVFELMKETAGVDLQMMLGYIDYETPFSNSLIKKLPLYYFPLSLQKLNNFITREVIAKDRVFYSIGALIKDIINKLLDTGFYTCTREAGTEATPLTPKIDYAFGKINTTDIFFIYDSKAFVNDLKGKKFGNYTHNKINKIPHFYIGGPDKGIAKQVQLRDIADPTLKTAVYYKPSPSKALIEGDEGPAFGRWAPVVFEAEVTTLGYPNFQLGQLVFIDVRRFIDATTARNFVATGYYGIHKITHRLTPDEFSTTINGIIQMSEKDKETLQSEANPANPSKGQKPSPTQTPGSPQPHTPGGNTGASNPGPTSLSTTQADRLSTAATALAEMTAFDATTLAKYRSKLSEAIKDAELKSALFEAGTSAPGKTIADEWQKAPGQMAKDAGSVLLDAALLANPIAGAVKTIQKGAELMDDDD